MTYKKHYEGLIWIGCSAILLFILIDHFIQGSLIIGSTITGFGVGIAFTNRFLINGNQKMKWDEYTKELMALYYQKFETIVWVSSGFILLILFLWLLCSVL